MKLVSMQKKGAKELCHRGNRIHKLTVGEHSDNLN